MREPEVNMIFRGGSRRICVLTLEEIEGILVELVRSNG